MRKVMALWVSSWVFCACGLGWVLRHTPAGNPHAAIRPASPSAVYTPSSAFAAAPEMPAVLRAGPVEVRDATGQEVYSFKPRAENSVKCADKDGNELCKLTFHNGVLKAQGPDGKPLFEVKKKADKVMIKDASGENELFKFKIKGQDFDFYTTDDRRVYRIKFSDSGYRLENNAGETLFRAKEKEGKMVLRDAQDRTVLSYKDIQYPLGLVFFRMPELSLAQQAACFVFFLQNS
jgi:hypothetical protein